MKLTQETLDRFAQQLAAEFVALLTEASSMATVAPVAPTSEEKSAAPVKSASPPTSVSVPTSAKKSTLPAPPSAKKSAKPTKPDKLAIIKALMMGESSERIAARFGVSLGTVRAFKANATRGTYRSR